MGGERCKGWLKTPAEIAPLVESAAGVESVIAIEGDVVEMPQAPGGIELHNLRIEVVSPVTEALPVSLNKRKIAANLTTLLDHAVITHRNPERRAMLRLGAGVMAGFRAVLMARDFTEIQTPKIRGSRHRKWRERLQAGLLRAVRVPGAKPAVLQADHGGRFRTRLSRLARSSAPSRTTPRATSTNT